MEMDTKPNFVHIKENRTDRYALCGEENPEQFTQLAWWPNHKAVADHPYDNMCYGCTDIADSHSANTLTAAINDMIAAATEGREDTRPESIMLDQLARAPEGSTQGMARLRMMLDADKFVILKGGGVRFNFKGCRDFNGLQIRLNGNDLYDMFFFRMNPIRMREEVDVDAASLSDVFKEVTGLDTHL